MTSNPALSFERTDAARDLPAARATDVAAVDCRGLTKRYGALVALDDVSLRIRPNEFFTLLGPSGCGKTTLLRSIAGFSTPDEGSIFLNGTRLDGLPPYRRPVNTVFQSYAVFPHMTVERNIAFGLEMDGVPRGEIAPRVGEMLRLVRLEGLEDRKPAQLSGGQQQRVAFARALAKGPRVLLLDEPLSALDQKLRTGMQLELKRLQRNVGITFIFVTHDQHEALTMSDRIAVMSEGRILQIGSPEEIYERPAVRFVADFIGETNFLEAEALGGRLFRTAAGMRLEAGEDATAGEKAALTIRPERIRLDRPGAQPLAATVDEIVYEGTDTTYYVDAGGGRLRVREQNGSSSRPRFAVGDAVSLRLPPESVRVLRQ